MIEELNRIEQEALRALEQAQDAAALEQWRVAHLGRSSPLMQALGRLGTLPKEDRPAAGQRANQVRQALEAAFAARDEALKRAALERSLASERLDVTLPGRPVRRAGLHPSTRTLRRILSILAEMGFQTYLSRDVETDEFNFQFLNFPPYHPAREMQDTFFVQAEGRGENPLLLRTHTSPGQIRAMREFAALDPKNPPPVRIALPGMCYRYEQITARSEAQFHQVEGLAVGEHITFANLKATIDDFLRRMFGADVRTRFRAHYFPFTEPSAEVDVECYVCGGKGCPVCKHSGWMEILGCGMVHPVVLQNGGYDPRRYSGFAFGMGIERQIMLRHQIGDIRHFWSNDIRFLEQF